MKWRIAFIASAAVLILSIAASIVLVELIHLAAANALQEARAEAEERDRLLAFIPLLGPSLSQPELVEAVGPAFPGEKPDLAQGEVQIRLYHFWFGKDGRLQGVQYGSYPASVPRAVLGRV